MNTRKMKMQTKRFGKKAQKKSQLWISDYTISLLLFIVAAIISVKIIINSFDSTNTFAELQADAAKISEMLLSEGYPNDWNSTNVIRPGLLTNDRLDEAKVIKAMNTSYLNYTSLIPKLQTKYDVMVVFENATGDIVDFGTAPDFCTIANDSIKDDNINWDINGCHNASFTFSHKNMALVKRLVVYNSSIVRMVVYTWQK